MSTDGDRFLMIRSSVVPAQTEIVIVENWFEELKASRGAEERRRRIALRLNTRPRKTLGYRTPAVTLAETVASTG